MKMVAALNRVADNLEGAGNASAESDRKKSHREVATIILLFGALGASIVGDVIYYKTLAATRRAAFLSHRDADRVLKATQEQTKLALRQLADAEADSKASDKREIQQAENNKIVADAAKDQAKATRASASAALQAAQASAQASEAQRRSADINAIAFMPSVAIVSTGIGGIKDKPDGDGNVTITIKPQFQNIGSTGFSTRPSKISIFIGNSLPATVSYETSEAFADNDYSAAAGTTFGPVEAEKWIVNGDVVKEVYAGTKKIFIYGILNFVDRGGSKGKFCFADLIELKDGNEIGLQSAGQPAYHCQQ